MFDFKKFAVDENLWIILTIKLLNFLYKKPKYMIVKPYEKNIENFW